mmetsp:Transcript_37413/g.120607  ORF Transcript_37413/g.120607 Transcript_37413/m.120607 type:complete len:217 (+) Transcript_37413:563-1213(+)
MSSSRPTRRRSWTSPASSCSGSSSQRASRRRSRCTTIRSSPSSRWQRRSTRRSARFAERRATTTRSAPTGGPPSRWPASAAPSAGRPATRRATARGTAPAQSSSCQRAPRRARWPTPTTPRSSPNSTRAPHGSRTEAAGARVSATCWLTFLQKSTNSGMRKALWSMQHSLCTRVTPFSRAVTSGAALLPRRRPLAAAAEAAPACGRAGRRPRRRSR